MLIENNFLFGKETNAYIHAMKRVEAQELNVPITRIETPCFKYLNSEMCKPSHSNMSSSFFQSGAAMFMPH